MTQIHQVINANTLQQFSKEKKHSYLQYYTERYKSFMIVRHKEINSLSQTYTKNQNQYNEKH